MRRCSRKPLAQMPLELELEAVVSLLIMGARNLTQVFWKNSGYS